MLKAANNAKAQVSWTLLASGTTLNVKDTKWGLFPSEYPYRCALVKLSWDVVTQREIVEVTNRVWNTFTISRAIENCAASDSATSQTQTAFEFADWDSFQLIRTAYRDTEIDNTLDNLDTTKLNISDYTQGQKIYWASSWWTDAYAITVDSSVTSYVSWQAFRFLADVWNTWAATLNVNSLWAKTIKKSNDRDLEDWDIEANQIVEVVYDGADDVFEMTSQIASLPTINIWDLSEDTTWDIDEDFFVKNNWLEVNKKIKISRYKATNTEFETWTSTKKLPTVAQTSWTFVAWTWLTVFSNSNTYSWILVWWTIFTLTAWNAWGYTFTCQLRSQSWTLDNIWVRVLNNAVNVWQWFLASVDTNYQTLTFNISWVDNTNTLVFEIFDNDWWTTWIFDINSPALTCNYRPNLLSDRTIV